MAQTPKKLTKTLEITNFTGRLTRILNGELNSGFAKFTSSFGYDPFSKPMNLTWLEVPQDIFGVSDLVLDGKIKNGAYEAGNPTAYLIGSKGNLYKTQISSDTNNSVNSVIGIASVKAGGATYLFGGSMEFFGFEEKIYVGSDNAVNSIRFDGSADKVVGNAANYAANGYKPLKQFAGSLIFGNGQTIGEIAATGTVTSSVFAVSSVSGNIYSSLNPPLPSGTNIRDLDTSIDNNYLLISGTESLYERVDGPSPALLSTMPTESKIFYWNGSDPAITAATTLGQNQIFALQSYLQQNHIFATDSFGAGIFNEGKKIITLTNNQPPLPNATGVNGQFLYWCAPEKIYLEGDTTPRLFGAMYYFGSLDQENPPGLYRICRITPVMFNGNIILMPFNKLVSVSYPDTNDSQSSVISAGIGTHYFSHMTVANNNVQSGSVLSLRSISVPPSGNFASQFGVYETQNQLFSRRIGLAQIRVYTEPTVANNAFRIEIIGGDGQPVENGTFNYSYVAGSDLTQMQGSLERINFNPNIKTLFSFGIRILNLGNANMTIKKIEIDYSPEGQ